MKNFTALYQNDNAKKQMNDLGLFEFFKSKNVIRIMNGEVYFNPFFLEAKGGFCYSNLSLTRLIVNFPELKSQFLHLRK